MRRIIILGNTVAGLTAAEELRKNDPECEIRMFSFDSQTTYCPSASADLVAGKVREKEAFFRPVSFYEKNNVILMKDKIHRINWNRARVVTEEKEVFEADYLLVADVELQTTTNVKGQNKNGFWLLPRAATLEQVVKNVPLIDTVVIQGASWGCLKMAVAINSVGKEVIVVNSAAEILAGVVPADAAVVIRELLAERGIRFINANSVVEILGDSDAKAIRLQSGKVLAAQMILWGETKYDLRLFNDAQLIEGERVAVDTCGRANIGHVLAVGPFTVQSGMAEEYDNASGFWCRRAQMVAAHLLGMSCPGTESVEPAKSALLIKDKLFQLVISSNAPSNAVSTDRVLVKNNLDAGQYVQAFFAGEVLLGVVAVNSQSDVQRLSELFAVTDVAVRADVLSQIFGAPCSSQVLPFAETSADTAVADGLTAAIDRILAEKLPEPAEAACQGTQS